MTDNASPLVRLGAKKTHKDKKGAWDKYSKWNANKTWQGWEKKQDKGHKGEQWNSGKLPLALKGCASATPDGKRIFASVTTFRHVTRHCLVALATKEHMFAPEELP